MWWAGLRWRRHWLVHAGNGRAHRVGHLPFFGGCRERWAGAAGGNLADLRSVTKTPCWILKKQAPVTVLDFSGKTMIAICQHTAEGFFGLVLVLGWWLVVG